MRGKFIASDGLLRRKVVGMRMKIASSLLLLGSSIGCYVQPYNPPPAQVGQQQPPPAQDQQPPPTYQQPDYQQPPPPPPQQQPPPPPVVQQTPPAPVYTGPVYDTVNVSVTGNNVPSVDVFYNDLAPYGSWYDDPTYGWVFAPPSSSYVPYSNGRWVYNDYGYTWVSADPFGWATDHYGRWVWANRWVWRPDTTWGPAWVQWRVGDGWVGWAPMGYSDDAYVPEDQWRFVPAPQLTSREVKRHYVVRDWSVYLRGTVSLLRFNKHRKDLWVASPDDDWLRRWK